MEGMVTWGPWGGNGGLPWNTGTLHAGRLARIRIWDGLAIDAMQFQYERNGEFHWTNKWGGDGGAQSEIVLEKGEILTFILGFFDKFQNYTVVKSLTLITNMHKHGPYGEEKGKLFCLPHAGSYVLAGFHGRSGQFIDCIGVYLRPIHLEISADPTTADTAHVSNEVDFWVVAL